MVANKQLIFHIQSKEKFAILQIGERKGWPPLLAPLCWVFLPRLPVLSREREGRAVMKRRVITLSRTKEDDFFSSFFLRCCSSSGNKKEKLFSLSRIRAAKRKGETRSICAEACFVCFHCQIKRDLLCPNIASVCRKRRKREARTWEVTWEVKHNESEAECSLNQDSLMPYYKQSGLAVRKANVGPRAKNLR